MFARRPLVMLAVVVAMTSVSLPAHADSPSPVPSGPPSGRADGPTGAPQTPTPSPSAVSSGVTPTAAPPASPPVTAATSPVRVPGVAASTAARPGLRLVVTSAGGPVPGAFYQDLGRFALTGTSVGVADGTVITFSRRIGTGAWTKVGRTTVLQGRFAAALPVQTAGLMTFRAGSTGREGAELLSPSVTVTVRDATLALDRPSPTVDSLKALPVRGRVVPARAGVSVHLDVRRGSHWHQVAATPTDAAGRFSTAVGYGRGALASYTVRATYHAGNTNRWESSTRRSFTRVAVLDPHVSATTGADVAKTYRRGCPVGPSKLRTLRLNYYGRDKRIHRGMIIIRTDLTQELTRAFGTALKHRYPIAKMNNPNVYGGNDPRQMAADNTSGFNCRKVVGNPYRMSPHSYGIALDVNTVQNPYRDDHGKWWPSNGKRYIDRSPLRWGMLGRTSALTASLAHDHFFWGGRWNPGRDYQHFEYHR